MLINKCLDKKKKENSSHLDQAALLFRDSRGHSMSPPLLLLSFPLFFSLSFTLLPPVGLLFQRDMDILERGWNWLCYMVVIWGKAKWYKCGILSIFSANNSETMNVRSAEKLRHTCSNNLGRGQIFQKKMDWIPGSPEFHLQKIVLPLNIVQSVETLHPYK